MSFIRNIGIGLIYYQVGKDVFGRTEKPKRRTPSSSEKKPTVVRSRFTQGQMVDLVRAKESMRRPKGYNLRTPVELSPRERLISIVRRSALTRRAFPIKGITKGRSELIRSVRSPMTRRPTVGNLNNSKIARFYYARRHV